MDRTYAVLWRVEHGPPRAGRLAISTDTVTLEGGGRNGPQTPDTIARGEIDEVWVEREFAQRLADLPTLVVALASGELYRVASVDRPGTLGEMARELGRRNGAGS